MQMSTRMSTVALVTIATLIVPELKSQTQPIGDAGATPEPSADPKFIDSLVQQIMPMALASMSSPEIVPLVSPSLETERIGDRSLESDILSTEDIEYLKLLIAQVVDRSMAENNRDLALASSDRLQQAEGTITLLNFLLVLLASVPVVALLLFWAIRRWVVADLVQMIHSELAEFSHLEEDLKEYHLRADGWMGELYRHLNIYKQHIRDELTIVHQQSQKSEASLEEINRVKQQMVRQFQEMLAEAEIEKNKLFTEIYQHRPSQIVEALPLNLASDPPDFSPSQLSRNIAVAIPDSAPTINPEELTVEDYNQQAKQLTESHRYEDAIAAYYKVLECLPNCYDTWLKIGQLYVKINQFNDAQNAYKKAININLNRDEAWYNLGNTLSKFERYTEALSAYERALTIHSERYETWYNRGTILTKLKRYSDAILSYDRALILNPHIWEIWYHRGNLLGWLGDYEKAISSYDKAVTLNSNSGETWYKQGLALGKLDRHQEALACYDIALSLDIQGEGLWRNRGIALENLHRYDEAIASYEQAATLQPQELDLWLKIGYLLNQLHRREDALNIYDRILHLHPNHSEALRCKNDILRKVNYDRDCAIAFPQIVPVGN